MRNLLVRANLKIFLVLTLLSLSMSLSGFAESMETRYTRFNIHTEFKGGKKHKASYANYTDPGAAHVIIPAGTEIVIYEIQRGWFNFEVKESGQKVNFDYHTKRMGMRIEEYIKIITSIEPISLEELSNLDKEGVTEGVAKIGMTKDGVLVALGYPAKHRTPSLDATTWTYWQNRFGTIAVKFDEEGKVKEIVD